MKRTLIAAALVLFGLLSVGCVDRKAQAQADETQKIVDDPQVPVVVQPASVRDVPATLDVAGSLKSSADVNVSSKASGQLAQVYVKEGDTVHAGQLVARIEGVEAQARLEAAEAGVRQAQASLDQVETDAKTAPSRTTFAVRAAEARVAQAQASLEKLQNGGRAAERKQAEDNVARAKSDLDYADKSLKRSQNLFEHGAISQADLEAAQNRRDEAASASDSAIQALNLTVAPARAEDLASARQAILSAQEDLKTAKATKLNDPIYQQRIDASRAALLSSIDQVKLARQVVRDLSLVAPISGKVVGAPVQAGTVVSPGLAVARIVDAAGSYFEGQVPEADVAKVSPGLPVTVRIDALGGMAIQGHVHSVDPVASSSARLYSVRVDLDTRSVAFRTGMYATGSIEVGIDHGVTLVPSSSVLVNGEENAVYATSGGKAKKYVVKVVSTVGQESVVTGLPASSQVVVRGQENLVDGTPVKVTPLADASVSKGA